MEITLSYTHAFIWYLDKSPNNKLSPKALKTIKEAEDSIYRLFTNNSFNGSTLFDSSARGVLIFPFHVSPIKLRRKR